MSERQTVAVIVVPTEQWAGIQRLLPKGSIAHAETPEGRRLDRVLRFGATDSLAAAVQSVVAGALERGAVPVKPRRRRTPAAKI